MACTDKDFVCDEKQCIVHTDDTICNSKRDVLHSDLFENMVGLFIRELLHRDSPLLSVPGLGDLATKSGLRHLLNIYGCLMTIPWNSLSPSCLQRIFFLNRHGGCLAQIC